MEKTRKGLTMNLRRFDGHKAGKRGTDGHGCRAGRDDGGIRVITVQAGCVMDGAAGPVGSYGKTECVSRMARPNCHNFRCPRDKCKT